jgi:PAS domain S-box-containing protein
LRIRPTSDRFWWIIAVGYLAVFAVLYVPDLQSAPLERFLNALLLGGPALILGHRLRRSPSGIRLTLFAGILALGLGLFLDVASEIPLLAGLPLVEGRPGSVRTVEAALLNLGFFLILVSCLQLLEHIRREQSELLRSREEAKVSSRRYHELFQGMRDAVFESAASGRFVSINRAGMDLLGYESEREILEVDIPSEIYADPADRHRLREAVESAGFVKDFPVRLRRRDGTLLDALVNSTASYDEAGRLTGYRGTIRDVTEQRRAQAEIARLQELNRNIIESLSHGLLVMDRDLRTVLYNRALERLTGAPREKMVGRPPWEVLASPSGLEHRIRRALGGETVACDRVPVFRGEGSEGYVAYTFSPLRDREGRIVGVIGFFEETTERMQLEQQLIQAEKVAAIGQMVSGIAHEINNPLTSVSGYAQLILASDCAPAVRGDVEKIAEAAERCGQVVKGLLTYSRKHEHRMTPVNLDEVLERTCELRAYELSVDDIALERVGGEELPFVRGDTYQLQQVLLNLLQNAADAIREEGVGGLIRIEGRRSGGSVTLGVFNSGPSIAPETIRRVFDPFFTTKEVGRGTGLGLSVAQNIVRNHGGTIRVRNVQGGVLFEITLPVLPDGEETAEIPAAEDSGVEISLGKARVLIVDDEPAIQDLFRSVLVDAEVVTAEDGRAALELIEAEDWDAVVSDVKMPGGVSGLDLLAWSREHRPELAPRFVIMTGAAVDGGRVKQSLPADALVLLKPFGLGELRSCVAKAVARSVPASADAGQPEPAAASGNGTSTRSTSASSSLATTR